jgi:hypothetical protein
MAKYKVTLEMKETYVLFVDSECEDSAIYEAGQLDLGAWESVGLATQSIDAVEVTAITEEDNI